MSEISTTDLHRDLLASLRQVPGTELMLIHHPLVVMPLGDDASFNVLANNALAERRGKMLKAKKKKDWWAYIWAYEKPYRPEVLMSIAKIIPPENFWLLVSQVWGDAETIHPNTDVWVKIWESDRPFRERVMTVDEHEAFAALPEIVRIYRGMAVKHDREPAGGLSWTTDRERAIGFAKLRSAGNSAPFLASATAKKSTFQAYFTRRNESEAVVFQEHYRRSITFTRV